MAVLELDPGPVGRLGDEADLDLAGLVEICLDLPAGADVPGEDDPARGVVSENSSPLALAPVDAAVIDPAARARLEHRLGDVDRQDVVVARLDRVEPLGEKAEGVLLRRLDHDVGPDRGLLRMRAHSFSFMDCSTIAL